MYMYRYEKRVKYYGHLENPEGISRFNAILLDFSPLDHSIVSIDRVVMI